MGEEEEERLKGEGHFGKPRSVIAALVISFSILL